MVVGKLCLFERWFVMKKYMVLLFVDSDFVHTDFFNDYNYALEFAHLEVSWNLGAHIYELRNGKYEFLQEF